MDKDTELLRLEQFVEKLLKKFSELKEERDGLLKSVAEKDETIASRNTTIEEKDGIIKEREGKIVELEAQLDAKNDERTKISNKVCSIMEQIESWELSLESGGDGGEKAGDSHNEHSGEGEQGETHLQKDLF